MASCQFAGVCTQVCDRWQSSCPDSVSSSCYQGVFAAGIQNSLKESLSLCPQCFSAVHLFCLQWLLCWLESSFLVAVREPRFCSPLLSFFGRICQIEANFKSSMCGACYWSKKTAQKGKCGISPLHFYLKRSRKFSGNKLYGLKNILRPLIILRKIYGIACNPPLSFQLFWNTQYKYIYLKIYI